jgi:anti-sigma-K factor RskA
VPPDSQADLAHPEAADWVLGTMGAAQADDFSRHLTDCPHCRAAVAEFGELGQMLQHLPPAAEPPPGLEARIIASVLAAAAKYPSPAADRRPDLEDQAATRIRPRPQIPQPGADDTRIRPIPQLQPPAERETRIRPIPELEPPAERETRFYPSTAGQPDPAEAEPQARPLVIRLPVWRHPRARLAAMAAAAAAIIIAVLIAIPNLDGGQGGSAQVTVAVSLHATTAAERIGDGAATGRATAHQAGPSWTFQMTVHGLKMLPDDEVYECWWVGPGSNKADPQLVSGGTFLVDNSGSATVTMTTGADPGEYRTMEVTAENPGTGALRGAVLLMGQTP